MYKMLWTNEDLLSLFAQSLSADSSLATNDLLLPLGPSSTIILEFTLQNVYNSDGTMTDATDLYVTGFINDQAVSLRACGG